MRLPHLEPGQVCLGAALLVPPPLAAELSAARRSFGDYEPSPPHITVIPPTPVPRAGFASLVERLGAGAAAFRPFRVHLRGTATFRPVSPVVYARLADGFDRCQALERLVRAALTGLEDRFPYHPHVTVANGCDEATLDHAQAALRHIDATFTVDSLAVCTLQPDGDWRMVQLLPFGAPPLPDAVQPPPPPRSAT
ncbi:MAG: 2'-5' RNA ligase family protein [Bifidobacteriaceae bacterium]|jgi:2'-5' RNA ligase|nr:2'-5' RNA ligase family protein [Bifidobacteriaceae bacterium]